MARVLSAHSVIAEYQGVRDNEACFVTKKYMRYAQPDKELGLGPQESWTTPVGVTADAQTAAMAEEAEGSLSAMIDSFVVGDLVELEWLQLLLEGGDQVRACQKLQKFTGLLDGGFTADAPFGGVAVGGTPIDAPTCPKRRPPAPDSRPGG